MKKYNQGIRIFVFEELKSTNRNSPDQAFGDRRGEPLADLQSIGNTLAIGRLKAPLHPFSTAILFPSSFLFFPLPS